jgi:predicted dehydrogenase
MLTRRSFLRRASAAAVTAPAVLRSAAERRKIRIAVIGVGNMGRHAVQAAAEEQLVALCDVDWRPLSRENCAYNIAARHPAVPRCTDFRELIASRADTFDAVMISTPDHTHFAAAMAAMAAGKHVFVQKPLAHNVWQVRTLQRAAQKYGVKTTMGNQGHTWEGIRLAREWFDAGVLGEVREVHCWTDRPVSKSGFLLPPPAGPAPTETVPAGLDWDLWQGPVEPRAYSPQYVPSYWRGWWAYGSGGLGDIGCHCLDAPFWVLQLGAPERVDVVCQQPGEFPDYTPPRTHLVFHFGARGALPPVQLHWYEGGLRPPALAGMPKGLPENGMIMKGSRETLYSSDMRVVSPQLWPRERQTAHHDVLRRRPLPRSVAGDPFGEFLAAVRGDIPEAGSNFAYACPLTELVCIGVLAIRSGRSIEWDAAGMRVKGSPEFDSWIKEPARPGWRYGEEL